MAVRTYQQNGLAPTATADATAIANGTYIGDFVGGSTTQRTWFLEIYLGGQAAASAPAIMQLARDSTLGVGTLSGGTDAPDDPATAALAAPVLVGNSFVTSAPQRSSTLKLLNLSFNPFGGIVRWTPLDPKQAPSMVGNAVNVGSVSLSAFTGTAASATMGAHVKYETA